MGVKMSNNKNLTDVVNKAHELFKGDDLYHLIKHLPEFIELLSAKLREDVFSEHEKGICSVNFLNFWKIQWKKSDAPGFNKLKSSFIATSAARKLTKDFNNSNELVNSDMEVYFHQKLTRPPTYLPLLHKLTAMAQNSSEIYPESMRTGTNVSYLFRVFFSTILRMTFEDKSCVIVPGIGSFERKFKAIPKLQSFETKGGVLHLSPNIK